MGARLSHSPVIRQRNFALQLDFEPTSTTTAAPKLENDAMCGITTGGQDECWWDCMIISESVLAGQAITNPECMKDCFATAASGTRESRKKERKNGKKGKKERKGGKKGRETSDSDSNCLALLIDDVTRKGTCNDGYNPAPELNIW